MDKIVELYEDLIRRNIAPSASLFVLLAIGHLMAAAMLSGTPSPSEMVHSWFVAFETLYKGIASVTLLGGIFFLILVGLSYILSALHQILYDNTLKKNFNTCIFHNNNNALLDDLREKVIYKLNLILEANDSNLHFPKFESIKPTDYILYEILGGIDSTSTRGYVNDAKAYGIVFISSILVVLQVAYGYLPTASFRGVLIFIVPVLFFLGRETVKAQYRARALRLYVNFLAMPDEKILRILRSDKSQTNQTTSSPSQEQTEGTA